MVLELDGGTGNDLIFGSAAGDFVTSGAGDDRFVWSSGDGSDVVESQPAST